jgi:hypothetical protein
VLRIYNFPLLVGTILAWALFVVPSELSHAPEQFTDSETIFIPMQQDGCMISPLLDQ